MLSRNESTFDGSRHVNERQFLVAEVVEVVFRRTASDHDRKFPMLLVVTNARLIAATVEQAQLVVEASVGIQIYRSFSM